MAKNSSRPVGRHFLQIPGPTPVPDRILRAMDTPIIDHRGPEFAKLAKKCLEGIKTIFKTSQSGDHLHRDRHRRLGSRAGQHAVARRHGADGGDRPVRHAVEEDGRALGLKPEFIHDRLAHTAPIRRRSRPSCAKTRRNEIKAVCVLHNETSTGASSPIAEVRKAIDAAGHPALLMVDTISSLASADYRHDEWGVDVIGRRRAEGPDAAARHVVQRASATRRSRRTRPPRCRSRSSPGTTC